MGKWKDKKKGSRQRADVPAVAKPRFFYVDAENVQARGLDRILELGPLDTVMPAYTDQVTRLDFDRVADILATDAEVIPVRVKNGGPNYADFQIAVMAVLNAERMGGGTEHIIVSRDRGYDLVVEMAWKMGVENITRRCSLVGEDKTASGRPRHEKGRAANPPKLATGIEHTLAARNPDGAARRAKGAPYTHASTGELLRGLGVSGKHAGTVLECLRATQSRGEFHNALVKKLGMKTATAVYSRVKPEYKAVKKAAAQEGEPSAS